MCTLLFRHTISSSNIFQNWQQMQAHINACDLRTTSLQNPNLYLAASLPTHYVFRPGMLSHLVHHHQPACYRNESGCHKTSGLSMAPVYRSEVSYSALWQKKRTP